MICKDGTDFQCVQTISEANENINDVKTRLVGMLAEKSYQCHECHTILQKPFSEPEILSNFLDMDCVYFRTFAQYYCNACMIKALTEAVMAIKQRQVAVHSRGAQ